MLQPSLHPSLFLCAPILRRLREGICLLCGALCASSVNAEQVTGSLAVTSDYIYRGLSQTRGDPAIQGSIQYAIPDPTLDPSRGNWVVGFWASSTRLNAIDGVTAEVDTYLSYRWQISGDWNGKLTALHYFHPFDSPGFHYDYDELSGSLSFRDSIFVNVSWSWNASRNSWYGYAKGNALSYEAAWVTPLPRSFSFNTGIGYYDLSDLFNTGYWYWNAGIGYDWQRWHSELAYIGSSHEAKRLFTTTPTGNRLSITLLRRF